MFKIIALVVLIVSLQALSGYSYKLDLDDADDDLKRELMEKSEAHEFFQRLFHPGKTKNEEIKREVRERFEEKCESVVPGQRFCPDLRFWNEFKNYENGE
jgi:hypothetical protein